MSNSSETSRRRLAVAVSGGGRSLANLLKRPAEEFTIAGVIASRACRGAEIAREHDLPLLLESFSGPQAKDVGSRVYAWLKLQQIDCVALAGFLKKFPLDPAWECRILNIHPALLPDFGGPGMFGDRVHTAVLAADAPLSGATVHFVEEEYDRGRILAQIEVPVIAGDDPSSLAARVFAGECDLYPKALAAFCRGELPRADGSIWRWRHDP